MKRFLAVFLTVVGATSPALGKGGNMQVDFFEPHYGQGTAVLNVPKTDLLPNLRPTFGAFFHTSSGLVSQRELDSAGNELSKQDVLGLSHKLEISAGVGIGGWFDVGITLPLVLDQSFETPQAVTLPDRFDAGGFSLQDIRIGIRTRLLNPDSAAGFGLGLAFGIYIPTGDPQQFTTDEQVRLEPKLLFDWRHDSGFAIGINAGVQIRPERTFYNVVNSDAFRWSAFTEVPLGVEGLHLLGTVFGAVSFADNLDPSNLSASEADIYNKPIEALGAVRYWWKEHHLVFQAGGGAGITQGLGAPAWRAFVSVDYTPSNNDRDGDGVADADDQCPDVPEDKDGFEDANGCPDVDNDKDGIEDANDKCPLKPEDKDSFEDADGCPDLDNDKDGIPDAVDRCPLKPEDNDGFQDEDGCPDLDNDKDGVLDTADKCPLKPEDRDGFEDLDGCPDLDNDKDGIPDLDDTCPMKPENKNNFQDEDGCPDNPKAKVQVTKQYITIKGKVNFATSKAKIRGKSSFALLNEVAQVLRDYPQITKLRIEGHTDSRGPSSSNLRLSDRRAAAVRTYLISKGVAASRLLSKGYGEDRPKVPNKGRKNMAINRRTEFFILEINGRPVAKDAKVEQTEGETK